MIRRRRLRELRDFDPTTAPMRMLAEKLDPTEWGQFAAEMRRWAEGGGTGEPPYIKWVREERRKERNNGSS